MPAERAKLAWRCRRGMRELDLLLTRFLEREFDSLGETDKVAFERLLECPDRQILAWITGTVPPPDGALERVAAAIRRTRATTGTNEPIP